jgi:hypothetical protein
MDSNVLNAFLPRVIAEVIGIATMAAALVVIFVHVSPRHRTAAWLIAAPPLVGLAMLFIRTGMNVLLSRHLDVQGYALFLQWGGVWGAIEGAVVTAIYLVGLVRLARAVPLPSAPANPPT